MRSGTVYYHNFTGDLCKLKADGLAEVKNVNQAIEDTVEYLTGLGFTPARVLVSIKGGKV